jgi:hypothetical protein
VGIKIGETEWLGHAIKMDQTRARKEMSESEDKTRCETIQTETARRCRETFTRRENEEMKNRHLSESRQMSLEGRTAKSYGTMFL